MASLFKKPNGSFYADGWSPKRKQVSLRTRTRPTARGRQGPSTAALAGAEAAFLNLRVGKCGTSTSPSVPTTA